MAALAESTCDMLVIDPVRSVRGRESFPTRDVLEKIAASRISLAYVNVGQAESYRTYWRPHWKAPTKDAPGSPEYLLTVDPDGWSGNYPVAYWDVRWRAVLWGAPDAPVDQAIADGFDGVYLDWILGFEEATVAAAADRAGVDPAAAMVELVAELRRYARSRDPGFLIVAQNCSELAERVPALLDVIDGAAQESLSYGGRADAKWGAPGAGDQPTDRLLSEAQARRLEAFRRRGLPVFTLDYAIDPAHVERARAASRKLGFIPFVSQSPLDRIP